MTQDTKIVCGGRRILMIEGRTLDGGITSGKLNPVKIGAERTGMPPRYKTIAGDRDSPTGRYKWGNVGKREAVYLPPALFDFESKMPNLEQHTPVQPLASQN
jgi:hypothetical protein